MTNRKEQKTIRRRLTSRLHSFQESANDFAKRRRRRMISVTRTGYGGTWVAHRKFIPGPGKNLGAVHIHGQGRTQEEYDAYVAAFERFLAKFGKLQRVESFFTGILYNSEVKKPCRQYAIEYKVFYAGWELLEKSGVPIETFTSVVENSKDNEEFVIFAKLAEKG